MTVNFLSLCVFVACRDFLSYSECQKKVSDYVCETQPEWMASNCKLSCGFCGKFNSMDHSSCRLYNFDLGRKNETITTARKSTLTLAKLQSFVAKM